MRRFNKEDAALIFTLALPSIIENALQVLLGSVDTYFVSSIGKEAVAGVGATNLIMNIYIAFFMALGVGATSLISRKIGSSNFDEANKFLKEAVRLSIFISLFFGLVNLLLGRWILIFLGLDKNVLPFTLPYFYSVSLPLVFLGTNMVMAASLRASGDTKTPMKAGIVANLINVVLDYILIRGFFSFGGLGVLGAGLATSISRFFSSYILFKKLTSYSGSLFLDFKSRENFSDQRAGLIKISLPAAYDKLIMRLGQLVYGSLIIKIGTDAYASHNIAGTIEAFTYLPATGFGIAAATLLGQQIGANKKDYGKKLVNDSFFLACLFMSFIGIFLFIFSKSLAMIFTEDPIIINMVSSVLKLIAFFQPFLAMTTILTSAIQASGDTKFPMKLTFIGIWGIRILGTIILGINLNMGLMGVWISYALDITLRGLILKRKMEEL